MMDHMACDICGDGLVVDIDMNMDKIWTLNGHSGTVLDEISLI